MPVEEAVRGFPARGRARVRFNTLRPLRLACFFRLGSLLSSCARSRFTAARAAASGLAARESQRSPASKRAREREASLWRCEREREKEV